MTVALPKPPGKPIRPADADSKQLWTVYWWNLERYNTYKHWDQDVIGVIWVKFPDGLTDKEIDTDGILPLSLTGRQALDHIEGKTITDIVST